MSLAGVQGRGRRGVFERDDCEGDGEKQRVEEGEVELGEEAKEEEREEEDKKKKRLVGKIRDDPALVERSSKGGLGTEEFLLVVVEKSMERRN